MGLERKLLLSLVVAGLVAAVGVGALTWPHATARSAKPAASSCVDRLLHDWRDGSIEGTYPIPCYDRTISELPADIRVYSSAEEDIRQARADRIARTAS